MNIYDTKCTSSETSLDVGIILLKISIVQSARRLVRGQELPADRRTERIISIVVHEVLHLASAVTTIVLTERRPCVTSGASTIGVASKIKPSNVDTLKHEVASGCRWATRCAYRTCG